MADKVETEVVVLGGGPGGYAAAFLAADRGMRVTLIDAAVKPGGTCLHIVCIPSKALLQDRKSTRLNSSHRCISYAVFGLKKKKKMEYLGYCSLTYSLFYVVKRLLLLVF